MTALMAALLLSKADASTVSGVAQGHVHVHSHGGSTHVHYHTHDETQSSNNPEDETGYSVERELSQDDICHCCHEHRNEGAENEAAIRSSSRDSLPTPVAHAEFPTVIPALSGPGEHRHHWPYARGRPPDQLVQIRTVVLLT